MFGGPANEPERPHAIYYIGGMCRMWPLYTQIHCIVSNYTVHIFISSRYVVKFSQFVGLSPTITAAGAVGTMHSTNNTHSEQRKGP